MPFEALDYWKRYQKNPTTTTYRLEGKRNFSAPKITVCQQPSFKESEKLEQLIEKGEIHNLSALIKTFGFSLEEVIPFCSINEDNVCFSGENSPIDENVVTEGKCR